MLQNNEITKHQEEPKTLSAITAEIDNIFLSLRKADQIIRHELIRLNQKKINPVKKNLIVPIDEKKIKSIINTLQNNHFVMDEFVLYMLKDKPGGIFDNIRKYNYHLNQRIKEQENNNQTKLIDIDEKLIYYIRHLGAMTYHLNIHLNLLTVLLKNSSVTPEKQHTTNRSIKELVTGYMVDKWGKRLRDVKFLEITIDGPYALVTWVLGDSIGDAILLQDEGYWQLINIRTGRFDIEDFENADVPSAVAERMLRLHRHKLGHHEAYGDS